ncbi:MAG: hypothetical protein JXA30_01965 [Deltaproteobacteria bacterium]|nr:hypothetical protein [Deltaproteobacteria bacterium]
MEGEEACDDDSDCDDLNNCNGIEICTSEHACDDSDPDLDEGAACDEDKSCWHGVCVQNSCGDKKRDPGEACDDGNLDPDDGCTPDCEWTCEEDSDCTNKDACLGVRVCRDDGQHGGLRVCTGGTPLEDGTGCEIRDARIKTLCGTSDLDKDGWCIKGVCTCSGCGDGEVNENEACDDGSLNGTADSPNHCSLNCQVVSCGNGELEGDEECDDGNNHRLDGCDAECKYEFAHRFTKLEIVTGAENVPEWCKYQANQFAEAFGSEQNMMGTGIRINILDVVNRRLSGLLAFGEHTYVLHVMDSDDTSMKTADNDITVGIYPGYPHKPTDSALDESVIVDSSYLNRETLLPEEFHAFRAMQAGGGRVLSREPTVVEILNVNGDIEPMSDFMMQLVFDLSTLSRPRIERFASYDEIKVADALRIPEVAGRDRTGLFCGAMGQEFNIRPITDTDTGFGFPPMARRCCKNRGDDIGSGYRNCENGVLTDQCDSQGDLIRQGCTVCFALSDSDTDFSTYLDNPCELMKTNPASCATLIQGIECDVDANGDSENDSWSVLFSFETERIRIFDRTLE